MIKKFHQLFEHTTLDGDLVTILNIAIDEDIEVDYKTYEENFVGSVSQFLDAKEIYQKDKIASILIKSKGKDIQIIRNVVERVMDLVDVVAAFRNRASRMPTYFTDVSLITEDAEWVKIFILPRFHKKFTQNKNNTSLSKYSGNHTEVYTMYYSDRMELFCRNKLSEYDPLSVDEDDISLEVLNLNNAGNDSYHIGLAGEYIDLMYCAKYVTSIIQNTTDSGYKYTITLQ